LDENERTRDQIMLGNGDSPYRRPRLTHIRVLTSSDSSLLPFKKDSSPPADSSCGRLPCSSLQGKPKVIGDPYVRSSCSAGSQTQASSCNRASQTGQWARGKNRDKISISAFGLKLFSAVADLSHSVSLCPRAQPIPPKNI